MTYKAHFDKEEGRIQTVKEHSEAVASLCEGFAVDNLKGVAYAVGLLHDIGKYQPSFQRRMDGENIRVEHSGCGAQAAAEQYGSDGSGKALALMMEYCIAGHHGGIPDGGGKACVMQEGTLSNRMERKFEDFDAWKGELALPELDAQAFLRYLEEDCGGDNVLRLERFSYLTRYLYSCLVDADSLDTAEFCRTRTERMLKADFEACLDKVNKRLGELSSSHCETELQRARSRLQAQVFQHAGQDAEIYLMNLPTGSGKTLASVKLALERAIKGKKRRIIYVIPYNGIIDQTVGEFEGLFGESLEILRHQSTFSYEDAKDYDEDYRTAAVQAAENWDAPFIVTTAVQFFESLHSNKRAKLRKLHNMGDSVLVFDEAHLMPQQYMKSCLLSIAWLTRSLHSEAIFLTATMPDFKKLIQMYALPDSKFCDLVDRGSEENKADFEAFQKCSYAYVGELEAEALLQRASEHPSSLIIVNSRKEAQRLYQLCGGEKYYLSTYLCAKDRAERIGEIRALLKRREGEQAGEGQPVTIISTSLIEAGIDLDVSAVFRELTGLDSILQAGGRCNREGKRERGQVTVFELASGAKKADSDERSAITLGLLKKYPVIDSQECIREYYDRLFFMRQQEAQENTISHSCRNPYDMPFAKYSDDFHIIADDMVSIAVPLDSESKGYIEKLRYGAAGMARKLQPYFCSVRKWELEDLRRQHAVEEYSGIYCLTNPDYYDKEGCGITFEAKDYIL